MLALRKSARSVVAWVREPSTRSVAPKGRTVATKRFGVASKRLYGGAAHDHHDDHHHHAPPPKIHITKFYQPIPSTTNKTEVQAAQEIKNVEGWLFGNKVAYVDPYKPLPEKETPGTNGWLFGRPVRFFHIFILFNFFCFVFFCSLLSCMPGY
jgi:hypothetical protein